MAESSIKKNYIYSLFNKLFAVFVPILVTPFLARVLEPDGNGAISFVASISSYFILFANLGVETYGQRVIAIHRGDSAYLKKFFIEITILRTLLTVVCLIPYYFCFVSSFNHTNNTLYAIYAITIFAVIFDFSWFFQGVENFKILAIANVLTRIVYVVLVFVFVKSKADLNLAALFAVINTVLPFIFVIPFIVKYLKGKIQGKINPFVHVKECLVYFIPTIAIQIYTVLDKTMIGLITGSDFENGYYEQAEKLIKLPLALITALFIIMRSRISYYYSLEEYDKIHDLIGKSVNVAFGFGFPLTFGILAVAPTLVPVYLGAGYDKCITLLYVFSPLILLISISNLLATHYFTPFNKQKQSNWFLIIGALINVALNSFLIYLLQSVGATIASVCAETVITILYIVYARKFVDPKIFIKIGCKYLIAACIMFVPVFIMEYFLPKTVWYLLLEAGTGVVIYFAALLLLRVEFVYTYLRIYKDKIVNKIKGKNKMVEAQNETAEGGENMPKKKEYDYLIVGAGLFGAVFAREAADRGKKVLVIEKRGSIAGNVYTEEIEGINVHKYGAHIFHTNDKEVWNYVNRFAEFNRYTNSPVANYHGELYSLPFNMYTFNKMWGVVTPEEAERKIAEQREKAGIGEPRNLEEQAISLVGTDIYEKLIKGYTQKQWGRPCNELPAFIIKRLPVRYTFDNNYFNALYQGIPIGGYTKMVEKMLDGVEVRLNTDYLERKSEFDGLAEKVIYTGAIDAYFGFRYGALEYRSVRFETEIIDKPNYQGNAVVNYTDAETPYTRIIEHKFFEFGTQPKTVISREYSSEWKQGDEPYYPVNDEKNGSLYAEYRRLGEAEPNVVFGGRLAEYKYYDMDAVIASALALCKKEFN